LISEKKFYAQFFEKKHAKIQKNSRSVGEDTTLAAAWKFLKFSPSRRRRLYFFGKNRRRRRRLSRSAYTSNNNQ
jgi:hypothetical protein